jgi:hypothetical protein
MKLNFHLKLGIGIVLVFGLLLVGFVLYEPVWFKVQEWRLVSEDAATREAAAKTVAGKGKKSIPYIIKWLKFCDDRLFFGACVAIGYLEDESWNLVVPAMTRTLKAPPSERTNALVTILNKRKYIFDKIDFDPKQYDAPCRLPWKHFSKESIVKRNICISFLLYKKDWLVRRCAAGELGYIKDYYSIDALISCLSKDEYGPVREICAWSLGNIKNAKAVPLLLEVLKNDPYSRTRIAAAAALGGIGDNQSVDQLISALQGNNSCINMRANAAIALGKIGDNRALSPLITILQNDNDSFVRRCTADALGMIGDMHVIIPLIEALKDTDEYVRKDVIKILNRLTNQDFGINYDKWKDWYENKYKLRR